MNFYSKNRLDADWTQEENDQNAWRIMLGSGLNTPELHLWKTAHPSQFGKIKSAKAGDI